MNLNQIIRRLRFSLQCGVMLAVLGASAGAATNVVTTLADSGPGSLRQAISSALPGDTITFSTTGTVTLTSGELFITKSLNLFGPGSDLLSVSGSKKFRVFRINTFTTVQLSGLTIRDGRVSNDFGAGILNAGSLTVTNSAIRENENDPGRGAGVYNRGTLSLISSRVLSNYAGTFRQYLNSYNTEDYSGAGGGLYNDDGSVVISDCAFTGNQAQGNGVGDHTFINKGSNARGGAAFVGGGNVTFMNCTVSSNLSIGGPGPFFIPGNGGDGGNSYGGAIYVSNGSVTLVNCTLVGNTSEGGSGNGNRHAGNGGDAYGGAGYVNSGSFSLVSCTVFSNSAAGGVRATGFLSSGVAGRGLANGIFRSNGVVSLRNTILNRSYGTFTSGGFNLFESSNDVAGLIASDLKDMNPRLGPLQDNGGPTRTHALLPGSPALDAGDDTRTGTDQRGWPRRSGAHVDIGAFEFGVPVPQRLSGLRPLTNGAFQFTFTNISDGTFSVLVSTNISLPRTQWFNLGPATLITNGLYEFTEPVAASNRHRFFQLRWP